ncbi:MAG TPA: ABC transporter ATP-binding protein [Acidimicrobiales bacterium]
MTAPALELVGVRAGYGPIEVLHGVDLSVGAGEVFGLLGPNGAGKSTTVSVCAGLIDPTQGDVRVAGRRANGMRPDLLARAGMCTVPEGRGVFPNLTVAENLTVATVVGTPLDEIEDDAYRRFPALADRSKQLAGRLSGGEQQMLAMARALATNPSVLVLDELSMGLAPMVVAELYEAVAAIAAEGVSMLIVEQFARHVLGICDRAAIMLGGTIAQVGTPSQLDAELSAAYLGKRSPTREEHA